MKNKLLIATAILILLVTVAHAQIPFEVMAGHKRASLDLMFFKFFKDEINSDTKFLFFNRNRALFNYQSATGQNAPQFGFTEAISYNYGKLKGFAPVAVFQVLNSGTFIKAGVQYAKVKPRFTFFSWFVSETNTNPTFDFFVLLRYTPKINEKLDGYIQFESLAALPTLSHLNKVFTQRARIGLKHRHWQGGFASDFSQIHQTKYYYSENIGTFIRYEF